MLREDGRNLMATGSQSAHPSTKLRAGSFENREGCGGLGCGADEKPKVSQPPEKSRRMASPQFVMENEQGGWQRD
jgi:hypothetical protein